MERPLLLALALACAHCASSEDGANPDDPAEPPAKRMDAGGRDAARDASRGEARDADNVATRDAAPARDGGATVRGDASSPVDDGELIAEGFSNLAIKPGRAFDQGKGDVHPSAGFTPPMGWTWFNVEGAKCRDGSPFGVFVHWGEQPEKLFLYFEGGGACANPGFCRLNQDNVSEQFLTGGESAVASLFILPSPQAPNGAGVFDLQNPDNPFLGWNQVYVPYCTGDVYAGTRSDVSIEGVDTKQSFYGGTNSKLLIARVAATFGAELTRFVAGGSSAGGYGAGINFGYLQDTLPGALGSVILDASPPFTNDYVPTCLQKRWRETWGVDAHYPPDCGSECRNAEGGNLFGIVDYWRRKYPRGTVSLLSGVHDEIIRLFFSLGNEGCANYQLDPETLFIGSIGQTYDPEKFKQGLLQLRDKYVDTNRVSSYYMNGFPNATAHQVLFRPRFYEKAAGASAPSPAQFLKSFIDGTMSQVGP
ncbi:MAG: pectin acetylesterase-family hydrolase [Polyangiales bacterium]